MNSMRMEVAEFEHREIDGVHCIGMVCFGCYIICGWMYMAGEADMGWRTIWISMFGSM
jgi:hypothetical protein